MDLVGPPISVAQEAINLAIREVGVEEVPRGSNSGPRVDQYLAAVGLKPGNAWCAAFVSWCILEAAKALNLAPAHRPSDHPSGSSLRLLELNAALRLDAPESCCVVVWDHGGGKGHCGLVIAVGGDVLHTVEGNTDPAGSRQGWGVFRRSDRRLDDPRIAGYLKIA